MCEIYGTIHRNVHVTPVQVFFSHVQTYTHMYMVACILMCGCGCISMQKAHGSHITK